MTTVGTLYNVHPAMEQERRHDYVKHYLQQRDHIKEGDVLLFAGRGLWSSLIKLWTNSHYSHVGLVAMWGERLMCLESIEGKGVRAVPLSQLVAEYHGLIHWYSLRDTEYIRAMAVSWAIEQLGSEYSWRQIAALMFGKTCDMDKAKWICSEFVQRALAKGHAAIDKQVMVPDDITRISGMEYRGVLNQ